MSRLWQAIDRFFFAPASSRPLVALRIGVALALLVRAALLASALGEFYTHYGLMQTEITDLFVGLPWMPRLATLTAPLMHLGLSELASVELCFAVYVVSLLYVLFGRFTRVAAFVACFLHLAFLTSGYYSSYGVDRFTHIMLFYFIFMPVSDWHASPSAGARLALRVVQLHLCIAYAGAGLEKIVGAQWRSGDAVWRAMMLPAFGQFDVSWLVPHAWLTRGLAWGTLLLEIGYAVFIWPRATRRAWILGLVGMHVGIAIFLGLYLFSAIMILLTVCAFGLPAWSTSAPTPHPAYGVDRD